MEPGKNRCQDVLNNRLVCLQIPPAQNEPTSLRQIEVELLVTWVTTLSPVTFVFIVVLALVAPNWNPLVRGQLLGAELNLKCNVQLTL